MKTPFVAVLVALSFVVAWVLAFPPFTQAWTVFVFLVPFIKWSFAEPRWRTYVFTSVVASWLAWFFILIWLRNIYPVWGWVGLSLLSAIMAGYSIVWLAAMRWAAPRLRVATRARRLGGLFALAGLWVVLDWVRGWLFSGFPWLPLSAAFWKLPLLLQLSEWTGQWGVTFIIVLVNLGLVCGTGAEASPKSRRWIWWPARFGPEIFIPFLLLNATILLNLGTLFREERPGPPLLRVGFVQPWSEMKWSEATALKNWETLRDLTLTFGTMNVDLVLWPEAAPPFLVSGPKTEEARAELQKLVNRLGKPLLFGAVAEAKPPAPGEASPGVTNSVFLLKPREGMQEVYYSKRHLVPYGEYIPLRKWFPFLGKVVPLGADTVPGTSAEVLPVRARNGSTLQAGPLVCYEDVFPQLAREEVQKGADILVVLTNDAWYGQEGGALQHASHSVLRAIETRRPVLRCGNNGWSGVVDQDGYAFPLLKEGAQLKSSWILLAEGSTYFRGASPMNVFASSVYQGRETFYVRYGDWFVAFSAVLAVLGLALLPRPARAAG